MRSSIGTGVVLAAALVAPSIARAQSAAVEGSVQIGPAVNEGPAATQPPPPMQPPPQQPVIAPAPQQQPVVYVMQPVPPGYFSQRPREYQGGPVPPGFHLENRPVTSLMIAGALIFGVPWALGTVVEPLLSFSTNNGLWMFVPVIGPIGFAASECCLSAGDVGLLTLDVIAQAGGIVMFIAGAAMHHRMLVPDRIASSRAPRLALVPGSAGSVAGASLSVSFF